MMNLRKTLAFSLLVALLFSFSACRSADEEVISDTQYDLLDTVCSISIYGMPEEDANKILKGAFALCRDYENILSRTVKGSDIYNVNHSNGEFVEITENTYELLQKSLYYAQLSEGKFDVTVGKLAELWDFQADKPKVPEQEKIENALVNIDYRNIELKEENGLYFARLLNTAVAIDLGGIAKGYIADKVTKYIEDQGASHALVNLGGNVVAIGTRSDGKPWNIGIEKPFTERKDIVGYVEVADATVVTSGIYERAFEQDGVLYHHILDVATGYPADTDVESVSIVTSKGHSVDADALSSICLLLGSEKGLALIEQMEGFEADIILKSGEIITTKNMNLKEYK